MVSPKDALRLMRYSAIESDVVYTVGSTVVTIKLLAQGSKISWRTWIDALNTCHATTQPLELHSLFSLLVVRQDLYDYVGAICSLR